MLSQPASESDIKDCGIDLADITSHQLVKDTDEYLPELISLHAALDDGIADLSMQRGRSVSLWPPQP